jgi:hypothetical protein
MQALWPPGADLAPWRIQKTSSFLTRAIRARKQNNQEMIGYSEAKRLLGMNIGIVAFRNPE